MQDQSGAISNAPVRIAPDYRAWMVVGLLWVVALLNYLDRLLITSMRDPIKDSISMTDAQFGLLTSTFLWVYAIVSPLAGYVADRFSRRAIILGSVIIWSSVTWLTGHVQSFEQLLCTRALMGISEACYIPAALALIADYHPGASRSLAIGLHMSGVYAGAALGGIGGYMAEHLGWRSGFSIFGVIGIGYGVILFFFLKNPASNAVRSTTTKNTGVSPQAALLALFGQPAFWLLLLATSVFGIANWGINGWLPTYLKEHFKLGLGEAGISATGYIQVASFVGVVAGGAWADRWSCHNRRGRALVPGIGFLISAPCLYMAATTGALPVALAGLVVYGLSRGFYDSNLMPVLRQVADEKFSATGYGFLNFVSCATGGAMIYVGGVLKDAHIQLGTVFQISAAGLLIAAFSFLAVKPRQESHA